MIKPHQDGLKLTIKQQKELLRRARKGESATILANDFGISRNMVSQYRRKYSVKGPTRGAPTLYIKFENKTKTLMQWAEETGFPLSTLAHRLKNGWTVKETLTTPRGQPRSRYQKIGPLLSDEVMVQTLLDQQRGCSLAELSKKYSVSKSYLARRLRDVRGTKSNYQWSADDPRKPAQVLVASLMSFLKKKRLLTEFKKFHLEHNKQ